MNMKFDRLRYTILFQKDEVRIKFRKWTHAIIMAADVVEKRCAGEHDYAIKEAPDTQHGGTKTSAAKKSTQPKKSSTLSRHIHNELERERRREQKRNMEALKVIVPLAKNESRHTTKTVLDRARVYVEDLVTRYQSDISYMENLRRNNRQLKFKLKRLEYHPLPYQYRQGSSSEWSSDSSMKSSRFSDTVSSYGGFSDSDSFSSDSEMDDLFMECDESEFQAVEEKPRRKPVMRPTVRPVQSPSQLKFSRMDIQ